MIANALSSPRAGCRATRQAELLPDDMPALHDAARVFQDDMPALHGAAGVFPDGMQALHGAAGVFLDDMPAMHGAAGVFLDDMPALHGAWVTCWRIFTAFFVRAALPLNPSPPPHENPDLGLRSILG